MSGLGQENCDESLPVSCGEKSENLKRPNSRQNTASRSSQYSSGSAPKSKRLKATSAEESDGVNSSWNDDDFSEPSHITSSEDSRSILSSIASHEVMPARGSSPKKSDSQHIKSLQTLAREIVKDPYQKPLPAARTLSYVTQRLERILSSQDGSSSSKQLNTSRPGSSVQFMDLPFCLGLARSLEVFDTLSGGFQLPSQAEELLKVAADRVFAGSYFQDASNIYSVLLVAEESKIHERTRPHTEVPLLTPRVVAAFRSARSVPQCKLVRDVLLKRISLNENRDGSVSELFIVYQFLAECCRRQGLTAKSSDHLEKSWVIAHQLNKVGDSRLTRDHSLLFYLYYKSAFPQLPSSKDLNFADMEDSSSESRHLAALGATPIGYDDFVAFCALVKSLGQEKETARRDNGAPDRHILRCVRDCVVWCGSIERDTQEATSLSKRFQHVWDAWQGDTTVPSDQPYGATVPEIEFGISTAENLHVCDQIASSIGGMQALSAMSYQAVADSYLKLFFSRVSTHLGRQPIQGMSNNPSRMSLAPTIASSLGSSNASFGYFKYASRSIKERVVGGPSIRSQESSSNLSHLSKMSDLTDLFRASSIQEQDETDVSNLRHKVGNMVGG
jgi:hypothetical protein